MNRWPSDEAPLSRESSATRRVVCTALTGGVLGAVLVRLGLEDAAAGRCKKLAEQCKKSDTCCGALICGRRRKHTAACNHKIPRRNCCIPQGEKCRKLEPCFCCGDSFCDERNTCQPIDR